MNQDRSSLQFTRLLVGTVVLLLLFACEPPPQSYGPRYGLGGEEEPSGVPSYRFYDEDAYLTADVDPNQYKRIAIVYVGKTSSSQVVQADKGEAGQKEAKEAASDASSVTSVDTLLYSNALAAAFAKRGVSLVERNQINALVREQQLAANELMDLSDKEKVQRLGKLLKADLLVQGSVFVEKGGYRTSKGGNMPFFSDTTGLTVSAIDATTGQVVWLNTTMAKRYVSSTDIRDDPASKQVSTATMIDEMVDRVLKTFYRQ
ncbi:MAG: hypothetical protein JRI68_27200 [Deltaproteobacteria bacterium]|nr:hypothetical protein [Deltaproteobacteria bacterium]